MKTLLIVFLVSFSLYSNEKIKIEGKLFCVVKGKKTKGYLFLKLKDEKQESFIIKTLEINTIARGSLIAHQSFSSYRNHKVLIYPKKYVFYNITSFDTTYGEITSVGCSTDKLAVKTKVIYLRDLNIQSNLAIISHIYKLLNEEDK